MPISPEYEFNPEQLIEDTRPLHKRFGSWLGKRDNVAFLMLICIAVIFLSPELPYITPMLTDILFAASMILCFWAYLIIKRTGLPLCFPESSGVIDPNEIDPETNKAVKAKGIIYLGNDRDTKEEVWLSDSMARTHMMFLGTTGAGKAVSDDTPVLTPLGWKLMRNVKVGDELCLPNGKTTRVKGVYPQGRKLMYKMTVKSGLMSKCCDEHLWQIKQNNEVSVSRTDQMIEMHRAGEKLEIPSINVLSSEVGFKSSVSNWSEIVSLEPGKMESCTCILVESAEHLFIVGDMNGNRKKGLVTHNTEFLLSVVYNALIHGSGFIYVDGKADSSLYGKIYSLARMMGREDDVRVINFQTGAKDIFGPQPFKMSNTLNPFSVGSSGMLTNLVVSLMATGKGDVWENRAISFVEAIMKPLVFLRDNYGLQLNVDVIRQYFDLKKLESLAFREADMYPGLIGAIDGLISYLDNLPAYDRSKFQQQGASTLEQHGFITMQLIRTFNSLADTYGYIMKTPLAEIDFVDVFLNRRILVVLLPALEKSDSELRNLGKIIVASIKATMAVGLGARLEGPWGKILDSKPTTAPSPFMSVLDEYGYYSVEGFAVVPAQARSLGFSAIFAGQDLPAFQKSSEKEADSTLANTNIKFCGKLICTKTAKYFTEYSGMGTFTRTSNFESNESGISSGYRPSQNASIERLDRITLNDLNRQKTGQWTLWYADKIFKVKSFFSTPTKVKDLRVNRLIGVARPDRHAVQFYRDSNRAFLESLAEEGGISSQIESIPLHDFMVTAEGVNKFQNKSGIDMALPSLIYYVNEAIKKAEAFDKLLENLRLGGVGNTEENTESEGDDTSDESTWTRERVVQRVPADYSVSSSVPASKPKSTGKGLFDDVWADLETPDESSANGDSIETSAGDDAIEGLQPDTGIPEQDDSVTGADILEWEQDNKFDDESPSLFNTSASQIETFTGATVYGVASSQTGGGKFKSSQGVLDREETEDGLEKIESALGATSQEASLHASVIGSKLASVTQYPITKPAKPVTAEVITDTAKRLQESLIHYNQRVELDDTE